MKGTRGKRSGASAVKLARLRILADAPEEQRTFARTLLEMEEHPALLEAALAVLEPHADPTLRPLLLALYNRLDGANDPGCHSRVAILRLLRQMVTKEDGPLLEGAACTYEYLPPGPSEVAAGLRSVGLVALSEADESLAGYHAVRLLVDPRTSDMSGQPAVTAAQVLAAQGAALPLYSYLLATTQAHPEVTAECLRNLTNIPASVLSGLVERYITGESEIVLLGLFDLLLAHRARPTYTPMILEFLGTTRLNNMYRYLVSAAIAGRHADLIAGIQVMAGQERDPRKAEILREALALR